MPEVIVKYKSKQALKALHDLAKLFDLNIVESLHDVKPFKTAQNENLPIAFAKKPNLKALAGIWEGKDITLNDLRKEAWGERI